MSAFIKDEYGVIGLTVSHIGLIIATAIILAAVFSFLYYNELQKNSELKNMATGLSILVEGMDTRFFDNTTSYFFPDKDYHYNVSISTEYIIINADGNWDNTISLKHRFTVRPWPRSNNVDWNNGEELHLFLQNKYTKNGNRSNPINKSDITSVKNWINTQKEQDEQTLAYYPFYVNKNYPVKIDKVIIFYDSDNDKTWKKEKDEKQELLIIYQNI